MARYVAFGHDEGVAHYRPDEGTEFTPGEVPESESCECGGVVVRVYRWRSRDGSECYRVCSEPWNCSCP